MLVLFCFNFHFGKKNKPGCLVTWISLSDWHNAAVTLTQGKSRRNGSFQFIHSSMKNSQIFPKFYT